MTETVIIHGLAHRGACDPGVAEFVRVATPAGPALPLYPQLNQTPQLGEAMVEVRDNGDIAVKAEVHHDQLEWLLGFPFLSVTIDDPEEGPRQIVQVAVTSQPADPLQLPYRIENVPSEIEYEFTHAYESVVVVDEAHMSSLQLGTDGSIHPVFDTTKSHMELRHRSERARKAIPDAIARGFGFDDWAAVEDSHELDNRWESTMYGTLREVMKAL